MPEKNGRGGLDLSAWVGANGVPEEAFIDLGYVPNVLMPQVLAEADVALFPNRCEGGTNLVAMEAMAMGLPTILADNTGQRDLLAEIGGIPLTRQGQAAAPHPGAGVEGWGESDIEEILAALETVYTKRQTLPDQAARMMGWAWDDQNERVFEAL